ncbi:uncharacterized protein Bfra_004380 [Botrytis fragariae]|uniref:Uncharacterized protein n=1 Tax=Botrytis fragariae TaxID=1964551 RepID=A0A8H6AVV4_9HELO|nr:uncharacterized protein Bfra_004380 [Botrytis fragariae]KAF5874375.1 hypothetical protein Bfra_004380 [Botrytis fragariae]
MSLVNSSSSSATLPLIKAKITITHLARLPERASIELFNLRTALEEHISLGVLDDRCPLRNTRNEIVY